MTESTRERRATHDAREVIETVRAEASAKPSTYSPLYRWMWVHHDTLRDELGVPGLRGQWGKVAAALAARGLTDGGGKTPTERTARETWWKVRRAKAAEGTPKPASPASPARPSPLARPQPLPAPPEPEDDLPSLDGPYTFELATPKGWKPGGGKPG